MRGNALLGLLAASAFCALAGTASAHAILSRAAPAVGATVHAPVTALHLRFTERVEPTLCRVTLTDAAHHTIAVTNLTAEGDGRILGGQVASLAPGVYHVVWHAVSIDTHITEGDYTFIVTP
ncbi:MAG: copper resistance protein CopC [Terricaulis sp.]